MRCRSLLLLGLGLVASAPFARAFDVPEGRWEPRTLVCPRTREALTIDGHLDEAPWREVSGTEPFVDIRGGDAPAPRLQTRAKLLWDDDNLYIGAELEEPQVWGTLNERDAVIYHDNDFEVFLDPNGDNRDYAELEINALNTVWDLLLVKPYRDGGPALNGWDMRGLRTAVFVDGKVNDPSDTDRGWSVEIAIPWAALRDCTGEMSCPPAVNDIWRVNFSRVEWQTDVVGGKYVKRTDAAGKPLPEDNWVWSPQGLVAMHYPERWGFVQFSDLPSSEPLPKLGIPAEAITDNRYLMPVYYAQRVFEEHLGYFANSLEQLEMPPAAIPFLTSRRDTGRFAMQSTAWQFEARLQTGQGFHHVDQGGRLWLTPLH